MEPGPASDIVSSVKDVFAAGAGAGTARAGDAAAARALAAELLDAIGAFRRVARRAARSAWRDQPLPQAQSELLRLAAARPGIRVADAARELRLAPNTVSTLVGRLAAAGLLGRARAAGDGRSVRLFATGKGVRRIGEWRDLRAELTARALRALPAGDAGTLAGAVPALLRLAARLDEQNDGGPAGHGHAAGGSR